MKPIQLILLSVIVMAAASCSKSESEYHYIDVQGPSSPIYADQSTDTLTITSTDSWESSTSAEWITPQTFSYQLSSEEFSQQKRSITINPNTTGVTRGSYFQLKADGRTYYRACVQVYWMNIINPSPLYRGLDNAEITSLQNIDDISDITAEFSTTVENVAVSDSIMFYLYAPTATLSTQDDWITLGQTSVKHDYKAISTLCNIPISINTNSTGAERTGTINITTSNGITTSISIKQKG